MSENTNTPRIIAIATTAGVGGVRPYDMFFNNSIPRVVSNATHRDVDVKDNLQHGEFKVYSEEAKYVHVSSGETTPN